MADGSELQQYGPHGLVGLISATVASVLTALGLGKKKSAEGNSQGKRIGDLETEVEVLKKLHAERNEGDAFKRAELEELKTNRTEAKAAIKEIERRLQWLEESDRRRP